MPRGGYGAAAPAAMGGGPGGWGPTVDAALRAYAAPGEARAAALYARSLEVSREVVPPGWRRKHEL